MQRNLNSGSAEGVTQTSSAPAFLDVPLPLRWDLLKPTILKLYIEQNTSLPKLVEIMRESYSFYAVENSYKYYFNLWGVTKNVPNKVKEAAIVALGKRARGTYSTPSISYKKDDDQVIPIDKKRIRRHITDSRKKNPVAQIRLGNNIFMHWNLPYRAFRSSVSRNTLDSPFGPTPDFLSIGSPGTQSTIAFRTQASPINAPTPTMVAVRGLKLDERAVLFVEAKHDALFQQLDVSEKKDVTTYFYQFWLFGFYTAKYWKFGPTEWTAHLLEFDRFKDIEAGSHSSPNTPMNNAGTPGTVATPRSDGSGRVRRDFANVPSVLCQWAIHAAIRIRYEGDEEDIEEAPVVMRGERDRSLPRWPSTHKQTFEEKLQAALDTNKFSTLDPKQLPMAMSRITEAARVSPQELLQESFAFSLVARNEELCWSLLRKVRLLSFEGTGIYPLHLLASFLDGSKTCCNLLDTVFYGLTEQNSIPDIYINNHGHTVLDNLFITILKGHTSITPDTVDDKWSKMKRFTGEEVDICGRWDADSPCIRELFAAGHSKIPLEWKHMFCHTSVQAICHCIGRLFGPQFAPSINTPSGLFMKECQACGTKLQLGPVHSLVLTACHLAQSGCSGENLFGMLACLVCLLVNGADPLQTAPISIAALMRKDSAIECSHEVIDPVQLVERIPSSLIEGWTEDVKLGWAVFCAMLRWARDERRGQQHTSGPEAKRKESIFQLFLEPMNEGMEERIQDDEESEDTDSNDGVADEESCQHAKPITGNFYGQSKYIGTMWAAIQTELLTYRRLAEVDPWISKNFDLRSVLEGLNNGGILPIRLVEEDMMAPFCLCGRFLDVTDEACACVDEVCKGDYFANVDVWSRSTFITIPGGGDDWYW